MPVKDYKLLDMHIYFSGIGGAGIGPLALIAHQAGYEVSGSDKQNSSYINYLRHKGINAIHIGQSVEAIAELHNNQPIDWFVYSSAVALENPNAPELLFAKDQNIKISKRDELINEILTQKHLKIIAIAGTHGKTTTTAMLTYLFKKQNIPISYLLPAKTSFAEMGEYNEGSEYFIYEADEFDRNFLSFEPEMSLISGVSWDHHEIYPSREDYQEAFREFISQSKQTLIWKEDSDYLGLTEGQGIVVLNSSDTQINKIDLIGKYNRLDAFLAVSTSHMITHATTDQLIGIINGFPGLSRRMEQIAPNLYTDYAHTPEKIKAALNAAKEIATSKDCRLVVVYEPLTDRRQHFIKEEYKNLFNGISKLYWLPSYLAREDQDNPILTPQELIAYLADPSLAEPAQKDNQLYAAIKKHLQNGDMVVGIAGGGGGSLDDYLRLKFAQ
ncbi:MAG TPA: Mur ligase domain-containing protein [Candidatus Saccharimonadales bacterium]|nr:Mur ligase domain-containing protein [Candidatus Saccharimonadales bacterium]